MVRFPEIDHDRASHGAGLSSNCCRYCENLEKGEDLKAKRPAVQTSNVRCDLSTVFDRFPYHAPALGLLPMLGLNHPRAIARFTFKASWPSDKCSDWTRQQLLSISSCTTAHTGKTSSTPEVVVNGLLPTTFIITTQVPIPCSPCYSRLRLS